MITLDADASGARIVSERQIYQLVRQRGAVAARAFEITFLDLGARAYVVGSGYPTKPHRDPPRFGSQWLTGCALAGTREASHSSMAGAGVTHRPAVMPV